MSDTPTKCSTCGKTASESGVATLNRCAQCKKTAYCNRDCQKEDWKTHKKVCGKRANTGAGNANNHSAPVLKNLEHHVPNPFTQLDQGKYLHDRPKQDVYKLLIDSFRMRQQDETQFENKTTPKSVYTGAASSIEPFRKYVAQAAARPGILPPWWTPETQRECEAFGESGTWNDLRKKVTKAEVIEHYGDEKAPMQLRMLAEAIIGAGLMGQDGSGMRKMMSSMESGGPGSGMKASMINVNQLFGGGH
jgi:splicing suppressor protein 51